MTVATWLMVLLAVVAGFALVILAAFGFVIVLNRMFGWAERKGWL